VNEKGYKLFAINFMEQSGVKIIAKPVGLELLALERTDYLAVCKGQTNRFIGARILKSKQKRKKEGKKNQQRGHE